MMLQETIDYIQPMTSRGSDRPPSSWALTAARWCRLGPSTAGTTRDGAALLHEFADLLQQARSSGAIPAMLVRLAGRASGASRVELYRSEAPGRRPRRLAAWPESPGAAHPECQPGDAPMRLHLGLGGRPWATLHLQAGRRRWPARTVRLLTTLGVMAAAAARSIEARGDATSRDPATGLYAEAHLEALLEYALAQSRRRRESLTLLAIGVDPVSLHDSHLAEVGVTESALQQVARVVAGTLRSSDIVAPLADGLLIAVLPGVGATNAGAIARSVRDAIAEAGRISASLTPPTASVGIATTSDHGLDADALRIAALRALEAARARGGNRVAVATSDPGDAPTAVLHAG